jgi:hypothetical protein
MWGAPVPIESPPPRWCLPAVALAAVVGFGLLAGSAWSMSATYDEVAYLRIAARWWRGGGQEEVTRMGSPLTFWKLQQAPVLWLLDHTGRRALVDESVERQAELLPLLRLGGLWVWLAALGATAWWARRLYGPKAMAFAAWLFVMSPNLLAHGALVTMEMPLVACTAGVFFFFWRYLETGRPREFLGSAALCGLAFSCKFTAVLFSPLIGLTWWIDHWTSRGWGWWAEPTLQKASTATSVGWAPPTIWNSSIRVVRGMLLFAAVMIAADLVVTGFAVLPLSHDTGVPHPSVEGKLARWPALARLVARAIETPIPQDLVGFATQVSHQRSGGPSYLLGERRTRGWWYYYFFALAVKVPLSFWLLTAARAWLGPAGKRDWVLPAVAAGFLVVTALGSSRNYGLRYLLPLSPLAVVWVSALAESKGWLRAIAFVGLAGQVLAVASVYPDELTYFNALAGGRAGGRYVLSDSNLDWGQGLKALARLQAKRPELKELTLYYFGDTEPRLYGVAGGAHVIDANLSRPFPARFEAATPYVAVSASLRWGPWGPPGYFGRLEGIEPVLSTDDTTIVIYRSGDVFREPAAQGPQ